MFTLVYSTRRSQGCVLSALPRTEINSRDAGRVACAYNRYLPMSWRYHPNARLGGRAVSRQNDLSLSHRYALYTALAGLPSCQPMRFDRTDAAMNSIHGAALASCKKCKEIFECRSSTFCASNDTCRFLTSSFTFPRSLSVICAFISCTKQLLLLLLLFWCYWNWSHFALFS